MKSGTQEIRENLTFQTLPHCVQIVTYIEKPLEYQMLGHMGGLKWSNKKRPVISVDPDRQRAEICHFLPIFGA